MRTSNWIRYKSIAVAFLFLIIVTLSGCAASGSGYGGMDPYAKPTTFQGKTIMQSNDTAHADETSPSTPLKVAGLK